MFKDYIYLVFLEVGIIIILLLVLVFAFVSWGGVGEWIGALAEY